MNMFPYIRSEGYFNRDYDAKDDTLKKYFIVQIPMNLYKDNIDSLPDAAGKVTFGNANSLMVRVCVVRSRRKDQADQVQMSLTSLDDSAFVEFRKALHTGDYLVILKHKERLMYDCFGIKGTDAIKGRYSLNDLNNKFYKLVTNTKVDINSSLQQESRNDYSQVVFNVPDIFNDSFSTRYIISLLTKPFVILTGNSGTGKTRIAKHFAQYLEKKVDGRKNWLIVPVGADWTDNTKLLGFYNPLEKKYVSTSTLEFILMAEKNPAVPFFLILDEMNLSHVERYFSDFLSAMESDEEIPLYKIPKNTTEDVAGGEIIPEKIRIPKNLFVTGTVNIDETTYMFSPKVLDRSNVVEFKPEKADILELMISPSGNEKIIVANDGSAEGFVALAADIKNGKCCVEEDRLILVRSFLESIYADLEKSGFEFAYRTVKEIRQYLAVSFELKKDEFSITRAMDEQLVQKILPKIYGDRKQIGELLESLEEKCKEGIGIREEGTTETLMLSLKKIEQMKVRLDKYQYASFM